MSIPPTIDPNDPLPAMRPFSDAQRWFEYTGAGLALLVGSDYQCAFANAAFMRMAGSRRLPGGAFFEAFPEFVDQGLRTLFDKVATENRTYVAYGRKVFLVEAGGVEWRAFDVALQPVFGAAGERQGIVLHCRASPRLGHRRW